MPEPIEITLLGTGSAVPTPERHHPSILLRFGTENILFDCGEGTQTQLEKVKMSPMKITRIFITHWHADHFAGLLPLIETLHLSRRTTPLEIYGPDASRFVDALMELSYWGIGFKIIPKDCKSGEKIFENDMFEITTVKVNHSVPAVGYCFKEKDHWHIDMKKAKKFDLQGKLLREIKEKGKIKGIKLKDVAKLTPGRKIIYSGDTTISKELFRVATGADLLIHDGTFIETEMLRSHSSAKMVAKLAKQHHVKKLILTHLSRRYKTNDEILKIVKPVYKNTVVAHDLMKIRI